MKGMLLFLCLPVLLTLSFAVGDQSFSSGTIVGADFINAVIGNKSFRAFYGREPNINDDEDLRIATHLAYVEALLRSRDVSHLSTDLQRARNRNLSALRIYRLQGEFPRNYDRPGRRPCFIDRDGRICAVGYLVEQTAGRDVAEGVNRTYKYSYIKDIEGADLAAWLAGSGLTREEAAMIQPEYHWQIDRSFLVNPTSMGIHAGWEGRINKDFGPSLLSGLPTAPNQSGFGNGVYAGLFLEFSLGPKYRKMGGMDRDISGFYSSQHFLEQVYVHIRPTVTYGTTSFEGSGSLWPAVLGNGTLAQVGTRYSGEVSYAQANVDALVAYYFGKSRLASNVQVALGPSVSIGGVFGDTRSERLDLTEPEAHFTDVSAAPSEVAGRKELVNGDINDVPALRFGVKAGVRYHGLNLGKSLHLIPSIWYTHDLTPIMSGSDWRAHSVHVGFDWILSSTARWGRL